VRLLLDEHIDPHVASALRRLGHDVVAVAERADLRGRTDADLLIVASAEPRVLVTADLQDFARLGARRLSNLRPHHGVVVFTQRTFPTSTRGVGRLADALARLLEAHPGDGDLDELVVWLQAPPGEPD
jgi:predicted nuclease of predicted toxin-antitoxin system